MPTGVLPIQPDYGSAYEREKKEFVREYEDNTYDWYDLSNVIGTVWEFKWGDLSKDERDALDAFWIAHKNGASRAAREFYFYDPAVVDAPDLSGASATGRHTGLFLDPKIKFPFDGPCRYSCTLRIKQLD